MFSKLLKSTTIGFDLIKNAIQHQIHAYIPFASF
ncbi:hypothetical protein BDCR2A_01257 [Borrelia duttonii CR2A]|uniref:Uncharacterized protein n=1 Tax=Borrelia duttonii CR2A TaxID=1432657 RepID=W6THB4_9SPIR|nr:hypothetical protein BDCR2A_01257 [Borrelia duttonii CR2A]